MKIRTNSWDLHVSVSENILTLESLDKSVTSVPLRSIERLDSFESKTGKYKVLVNGKNYTLLLEGLSASEAKDVVLRLGHAAFSGTEFQDINLGVQ